MNDMRDWMQTRIQLRVQLSHNLLLHIIILIPVDLGPN